MEECIGVPFKRPGYYVIRERDGMLVVGPCRTGEAADQEAYLLNCDGDGNSYVVKWVAAA